jgi:hypothetical protein
LQSRTYVWTEHGCGEEVGDHACVQACTACRHRSAWNSSWPLTFRHMDNRRILRMLHQANKPNRTEYAVHAASSKANCTQYAIHFFKGWLQWKSGEQRVATSKTLLWQTSWRQRWTAAKVNLKVHHPHRPLNERPARFQG